MARDVHGCLRRDAGNSRVSLSLVANRKPSGLKLSSMAVFIAAPYKMEIKIQKIEGLNNSTEH